MNGYDALWWEIDPTAPARSRPAMPADPPCDAPLIVDAAAPAALECSPDEWVAGAARHVAAGVRRVRLDAIPDGAPWTDEPAVLDPAADTWAFAPWPGVAFELPLED